MTGPGVNQKFDQQMRRWRYRPYAELKLDKGTWFDLVFKDAKTHCVPRVLVKRVIADIQGRGHPCQWWRATDMTALDPGGMCIAYLKPHKAQVGSLRIEISNIDVGLFAEALKKLPLRHFPDRAPYHKLHSQFWCLVMTPKFKQALERRLFADKDECGRKAEEETTAWKRKFGKAEEIPVVQAEVIEPPPQLSLLDRAAEPKE